MGPARLPGIIDVRFSRARERAPRVRLPAVPCDRRAVFLGELTPYNPWQRRLLPWFSLVALVLLAIVWLEQRQPANWLVFVLRTILLAFAITGLASARWGCNRCVVRVWGDV